MSIFSHVAKPNVSHNTFDLSHEKKFSAKIGELIPILCTETVPGDTFNIKSSNMLRFAPMIAPVMHQTSVYTHFFFVPNRILWENWEQFITGGEYFQSQPTFPYANPSQGQTIVEGSLADYMGLPTYDVNIPGSGDYSNTDISVLPFAAYNKIYNEYYRDQNLQPIPLTDTVSDGLNNFADFNYLKSRAWQHDYFTSALPFTQKGPEATLPLGSSAPILYNNNGFETTTVYSPSGTVGTGTLASNSAGSLLRAGSPAAIDNSNTLEADLSNATAASINDLRRAFRLQEFLERNARGGTRYIEVIQSHFGVKSSDARLQRPEFLGGTSTPVQISEVLQTSDASAEVTPQGNMAGHGLAVGSGDRISYSCEEHGYIIGIMSVMPKTAYQQGIPKHFTKFDKFDYFWPSFANIGEQPIYNREIFHDNSNDNDDIFGYTPRYAEYKYLPSTVHGEMRSSLNFWHMGRIFPSRPALNSQFITCSSDEVERIFAVADSETLYCYLHNDIKARRPMPYFGTPTI